MLAIAFVSAIPAQGQAFDEFTFNMVGRF